MPDKNVAQAVHFLPNPFYQGLIPCYRRQFFSVLFPGDTGAGAGSGEGPGRSLDDHVIFHPGRHLGNGATAILAVFRVNSVNTRRFSGLASFAGLHWHP